MAGSLNKVILVGRLGKDPEVRNAQDGSKIVTLSVATSESWKDKSSGERKEKTEWHKVVIFNDALGGVAEKYLKKGSKAYLEGQLQTRKWTDQQGQEKYTTEIILQRYNGQLILLDGKDESATSSYDNQQGSTNTYNPGNASNNQSYASKTISPTSATAPASTPDFSSFINDEIPF